MSNTLVSIIVPSYGRPDTLRVCIESLIKQSLKSIEIIVIDDNGKGTENQIITENLINNLNNKFQVEISYHALSVNMGGAHARNKGVELSNSDIVGFIDNDDLALPNRVEEQYKKLIEFSSRNPRIKACLCLPIRKKNGVEVNREDFKFKENYLFELLSLEVNLQIGSSIILFKDAYNLLNGFDGKFRRNQDLEFMIRYYEKFDAIILNQYLIVANIDDRSNTPSYRKILETKELFLLKFDSLIKKFSIEKQNKILSMHQLEISKVALWNKNIIAFFRHFYLAKLNLKESLYYFSDVAKKILLHK